MRSLVASLLLASQAWAASPQQVFEFSSTFIENIHVRPNGHLLLSSVDTSVLFTLDPTARTPSAKPVVNLTDSSGLTGMATVGHDLFAVSSGMHTDFAFVNNSMQVSVVHIPNHSDRGRVIQTIPVPGTEMLNGMAALPSNPSVVMSADSIGGRVFRINTQTSEVDVAFEDPLLGFGNNTLVPLGANGLKIRGDHLYFSNAGLGFFARVPIDSSGNKAGDIEIVARISGTVGLTNAYDDFDFDEAGNAYVAVHSYSVNKITPQGVQTRIAGGTNSSSSFKEPTSAALSLDGKSIYVCTGGGTIDRTVYGGQVIQIPLGHE